MSWIHMWKQFQTHLQIYFQSTSRPGCTLSGANGDRIMQAPSHHQRCTVLDSLSILLHVLDSIKLSKAQAKVRYSTGTQGCGSLLFVWLIIASIPMILVCCSCNVFCCSCNFGLLSKPLLLAIGTLE